MPATGPALARPTNLPVLSAPRSGAGPGGTLSGVTLDTGAPPTPPEAPDNRLPTDEHDGPVASTSPRRWSAPMVALLAVLVTLVLVGGAALVWQRSTTPGADSVDVGFMQDMTTHHGQAIEIASIGAENATDPEVRAFAREVLIFQQYEVGYMEALLEGWGQWPFDPQRTAMEWMGMASPVSAMPGMQPDAAVEQLRGVTGPDADAGFLRMMTDHHRGGLHMAEYAARHASDERVRSLAERMATQQRGEIADYRRAAERLGITL